MPISIRPFRRFSLHCSVRYHAGPFPTLPLAYVLGFGVLIALQALSSVPAYGEWVAIGYSESLGGYTVYVDPTTIRRTGDLVKVWALTDYPTMQIVSGLSFLSSKSQNEFNCVEELQHELTVTWFSGNMGNGNGVWNNSDETNWRPVSPGSVGEGVWKFACNCAIIPCPT